MAILFWKVPKDAEPSEHYGFVQELLLLSLQNTSQ